MASTYTATSMDTVFAANKSMISVFNEVGSTDVVRVYRIWAFNNQVTAVTGVLTNLEIRRLTASTGGTTITPVKHDTTNATLSTVTCATNSTVTSTDLFRRVVWSTDEPAANATITLDEFQVLMPIATLWSQGYGDTSVSPITLRAGDGVAVINTGASSGQADFFIEFTVGAS